MKDFGTPSLQMERATRFEQYSGFLKANNEAYEKLVRRIDTEQRRMSADEMLDLVDRASRFAMNFHPGRFADGALENRALHIGIGLPVFDDDRTCFLPSPSWKTGRRRILHVTTSILGVGGHTRMLYNWIRQDHDSCHSLVVVNQQKFGIPQWLPDAIHGEGGTVVFLSAEKGLCEKGRALRAYARRYADLVVLHHFGNDVVPILAFAQPAGPPVALLNHADHEFWLGSSVSDLVINLRTQGAHHTRARRFTNSNAVIPIPLEDRRSSISQSEARSTLGIPEDQLMLLSVGRELKYRPCAGYDFVGTAAKLLDRQQRAHLYVVGASRAGMSPYLRSRIHERLHFCGPVDAPSLYQAASDVYLESFPFGSQTALLEAALRGLPVVPSYAPLFPLLVANDDAIADLLPNPDSEAEYLEQVDALICRPEQRIFLGEMLRKRLVADHVGGGWLDRLKQLYKQADGLSHSPGEIPIPSCMVEDADIGLSLWHAVADGRRYSFGGPDDLNVQVWRHSSFVARSAGDYPGARRYAWLSLRHSLWRKASWRLLAIALLGRGGGAMRSFLQGIRARMQRKTSNR